MALEIPKEDAGSIAIIQGLRPPLLDKFVSAIEASPPLSNAEEMARRIAKQVPSIPIDRLTAVLETLYTLYHIRELSGVRHGRFLDDLISAIRNNEYVKVSQKDLSKLYGLLERLMSIKTLAMVSKAARLQRDGERLYCQAKILSDIRPVFSDDPTVKPLGAVITHTLKIGYHEGSSHREFHVVLDSDDLGALEDVLQRAVAKDQTLREHLKSIDLPNLAE